MLGILVQLIISWVLLRVFYRENLGALGITPTKSRMSQLALGFIFTALLCTVIQLVDSALTNTDWKLNENLSVLGTLNFLWWNVKSVVFEELIFRGACSISLSVNGEREQELYYPRLSLAATTGFLLEYSEILF